MTTELVPHNFMAEGQTTANLATAARLLPVQPNRAHRLLTATIERTPTDHPAYPALVGAALRLWQGADPAAVAASLAHFALALGGAQ